MKTENRFDQIVTISAVIFLVIGCFVVLRPFLSALVWAAIICFSTWPIYKRFENWLNGRRTLAATLMTFIVSLVIVIPIALIGISVVNNIASLIPAIKSWIHEGPPQPPAWIENLPIVGGMIHTYWENITHNSGQMLSVAKNFLSEWKGWFLARSLDLGQILIQLTLSVFISFFIYRDGMTVVQKLMTAEKRIAGERTQRLLDVVGGTVRGVVYGILGTAAAQGCLAGIGLWIAGVPYPLWGGILTFFLSLVPVGPPVVWVSATLWLFVTEGVAAWRWIFMLVWGLCIVSGVDNVLKPYLISRGSNLPFVLVFLGVFGGIFAFGVIGIFVGPTLIAVGYVLLQEWSSRRVGETE